MTDIASLGIKVDTGPVNAAAAALDKLTASGRSAEQASQRLTAASQKENAEISRTYGIRQQMTQGQLNTIKNYETLIGKQTLLAAGMKREAAQHVALRQAGTTADTRYGQVVLALAGHHYDLEQAQEKANRSGSNLVTTLTRRFILGFAISQIRGMISALVNLNSELAKTGDVGRITGIGGQGIQGLQASAAAKGIGNDELLDSMTNFARQVDLAKIGVGELGTLLRANGQPVKDTEDAFNRVANLVANAKDDIGKFSILQQAGLPATVAMVKWLEQGADAIKRQSDESTKLSDEQLRHADELDQKFNTLWDNFTRHGKSAIVALTDSDEWKKAFSLDSGFLGILPPLKIPTPPAQNLGSDAATSGGFPLAPRIPAAVTVTGGRPTINPAAQAAALNFEQQRLGLLGQTTTALQQVRLVEIQVAQARAAGVSITSAEVDNLRRLALENALGITAIHAATDAHRVEAQTIGMATGEAAAYTAVQNKLNEARRLGVALSGPQIEAIRQEAAALGEAAQHAEDMKWGYENLVRGPLQSFRGELMRGATVFDALKKAGISALDAISSKLMDMAAQNLWKAAFPTGGGGMGGLLGLLGIGGGGGAANVETPAWNTLNSIDAQVAHSGYGPGDRMNFRYVHPNYHDDAPRFHSGIGPGERKAIIRTDESVLTPGQMKAMGGAGGPSVTINQTNNFTNADPGSEARMRQWSTQTKDAAVREAVVAVASARSTTPQYDRGRR